MALQGQVALVVGGASGIGLATAKELLKEGANVAVCDISTDGKHVVEILQAELSDQRVIFVQVDVRNISQFESAFSETKKKWGRLDLVVNSAGLCDEQDWSKAVDVNFKGVILGAEMAWKYMGKHHGGKGGVLVNIASLSAIIPCYVIPIYSGTKHAVLGYSRSIGDPYYLNRTGVRVITLCPSFTDTPIYITTKLAIEELYEHAKKIKEEFLSQKVESAAKAVLHVARIGESGSVWVSEDDKPASQVVFPNYTDMQVASE